MQIPISVNRSKAARPTACSRYAGPAASVWRGARRGRGPVGSRPEQGEAGWERAAVQGAAAESCPGWSPPCPGGAGKGGCGAWLSLCPLLGLPTSSAPVVPTPPSVRSFSWDARWSPAPLLALLLTPSSHQLLNPGSWDALILRRDLPSPHLSYINPAWKKGVSLRQELGIS